jgi:hypothetical protein
MKITTVVPWLVKAEGTGWGGDYDDNYDRESHDCEHDSGAQFVGRWGGSIADRADLEQDFQVVYLHGIERGDLPGGERDRHL